jgi:hypothetical protein
LSIPEFNFTQAYETVEPILYPIFLSRIRGRIITSVDVFTDVYADKLQELFTEQTGLATDL